MDDSFKLLEEKIRKAAERMRRLEAENASVRAELGRAQASLQEAGRRAEAADKRREAADRQLRDSGSRPGPEDAPQLEALSREVKGLRREREELRARIARLVETLDGLE